MHINLNKAVTLEVGRLNQPVVTLYQVAIVIFKLYQARTYRGEKLVHLKKKHPERSDCMRVIRDLEGLGILEKSVSVRHPEVFSVLGREQGPVEEVVCSIDPFAYISHLSAMEWHGLTDRIARTLTYSSPPPKQWQQFAYEKMRKDIGEDEVQDYRQQRLPHLKRLNLRRIGRITVHRYLSEHLGAFVSVQGRSLRVSTIGRTFLDMIREPDLCGGIYHVLEVYDEHVPRYLKLVVDEIDRHGRDIDKVRAGYILEEHMRLSEPRIENWRQFVQRGGSRKLYARSPYSANYSENWCLSINVDL